MNKWYRRASYAVIVAVCLPVGVALGYFSGLGGRRRCNCMSIAMGAWSAYMAISQSRTICNWVAFVCIAVYGKFQDAMRHNNRDVEMFIDTTPGTPPIYRRDALTRLFTVGYDVARNVFFGSDNHVNAYDAAYARTWIERDRAIFAEIGVDTMTVNNVFGENLKRFLGIAQA